MGGLGLWARWSWRDLRARWALVLALALVIALAAGMSTGLGSLQSWRERSADESFALLGLHDLRLSLTEGAFAPEGSLRAAAASIPGAGQVEAGAERIVVPTQVDASRPGRAVIVPARLVGAPVSGPGATIDRVWPERGRALGPADAGRPVAVIEAAFADHYGLPPAGSLRLPGDRRLDWTGHGRQPEWFVVSAEGAEWGAETTLAVLFTSLETAQRLGGRPGAVNELVVRLRPGADAAAVGRQLRAAVAARLPGMGASVTAGADEDAPRLLYEDAENDQLMIDVFAWLLLAGAALAAFNLVSRVVESQRREIGIGMALGVPPRWLAARPLLLGLQVAVAGVALGVAVGLWVAALLRPLLREMLPMPVLVTPFRPEVFARGAALGVAVPLLAAAYPVWRGVRVAPVEAIRVGARTAGGSGLARVAAGLRLPGGSLGQMPLRNLLRTPRRTAMGVLGLAAVLTVLVALGGIFDSFERTLSRAREEALAGSPQRMSVALERPLALGSAELAAVAGAPEVGRAQPVLTLPGAAVAGRRRVDLRLELLDPGGPVWSPRIAEGRLEPGREGVVLAREAARDLGLGVGDRVGLAHPVRTGAASYRVEVTPTTVVGLHASPLRFLAYMDRGQAARMGLAGVANALEVAPAPGVSQAAVQRALFGMSGVASAQPAAAGTDALSEMLDDFLSILRFAQVVVLLIALLTAVNTTAINTEERGREHATMLAFGVPPSRVTAMAMGESALTGVLGTLVGIGAGLLVLVWVVRDVTSEVLADLGVEVALSGGTIAIAAAVGVAASAVAPLVTARRVGRMDVPSGLRVVE